MAKVIPINERFQHFVEELQESFWGDLYGRTRLAWKKFFELESERLRDRYAGWPQHGGERGNPEAIATGIMSAVLPPCSARYGCGSRGPEGRVSCRPG